MLRLSKVLTEPYLIKRLSKYSKESEWIYAACKANLKDVSEKDVNHLGIDVGKRKCIAALKDDKG